MRAILPLHPSIALFTDAPPPRLLSAPASRLRHAAGATREREGGGEGSGQEDVRVFDTAVLSCVSGRRRVCDHLALHAPPARPRPPSAPSTSVRPPHSTLPLVRLSPTPHHVRIPRSPNAGPIRAHELLRTVPDESLRTVANESVHTIPDEHIHPGWPLVRRGVLPAARIALFAPDHARVDDAPAHLHAYPRPVSLTGMPVLSAGLPPSEQSWRDQLHALQDHGYMRTAQVPSEAQSPGYASAAQALDYTSAVQEQCAEAYHPQSAQRRGAGAAPQGDVAPPPAACRNVSPRRQRASTTDACQPQRQRRREWKRGRRDARVERPPLRVPRGQGACVSKGVGAGRVRGAAACYFSALHYLACRVCYRGGGAAAANVARRVPRVRPLVPALPLAGRKGWGWGAADAAGSGGGVGGAFPFLPARSEGEVSDPLSASSSYSISPSASLSPPILYPPVHKRENEERDKGPRELF